MSTLADIRTKVVGIVRDNSGKLVNPTDYDRNIAAAISQYSKHRPAVKVADITGNGTHDYPMPASGAITIWDDEFSTVKSIEYPVGEIPATFLENDEYEIYQTPTAKKIRLKNNSPSAAETFRMSFTSLRTDATIPDADVDALCNLAGSLCLEELANVYVQTSDPTVSADSVDYKSKSAEFGARAKRLMQLYKEHIGIKEDDVALPASVVSDLDVNYPGGGDRLTHTRWMREKR